MGLAWAGKAVVVPGEQWLCGERGMAAWPLWAQTGSLGFWEVDQMTLPVSAGWLPGRFADNRIGGWQLKLAFCLHLHSAALGI